MTLVLLLFIVWNEVSKTDSIGQQLIKCVYCCLFSASWASDVASEGGEVASSMSSSDGSFLAEADFASAVAKAAELSGLTVVGSTVTDPNAGQKGKHPHIPYPFSLISFSDTNAVQKTDQ